MIRCIKVLFLCQKAGTLLGARFLVPRLRRDMIRFAQTREGHTLPSRALPMRICGLILRTSSSEERSESEERSSVPFPRFA